MRTKYELLCHHCFRGNAWMKTEIKRAIMNRRFYIAAFVLLTGYIGYSIPSWAFSSNWGYEFRESALQLSLGGIYYGSVILLLPFCSCIPYAVSQVDEINSGCFAYEIMRSSIIGYTCKKMIAGMISGALLAGGTFLLHASIWNIVGMPYDPVKYPYHEMDILESCLYFGWDRVFYGLPIYVYIAVSMGFCAAIWSVVSLCVAVWIPDRMLTMVLPVCVYRLWSCRVPYYVFGVDLPHPSAMFNDGLTSETLTSSLAMYLVLLCCSGFCYLGGVVKRGRNA